MLAARLEKLRAPTLVSVALGVVASLVVIGLRSAGFFQFVELASYDIYLRCVITGRPPIKNLYDNYKWDRVTSQEQDRLAIAFNNEVSPVVDAMEVRIAELESWVDAKYAEWHRLLEELFEVESELNRGTAANP